MMKNKGVQLFIVVEGVALAVWGAARGEAATAAIGAALVAYTLYGLYGRGEAATFITGERDERQSAAFDAAYRFGFGAVMLWVVGISLAYGGRGSVPVGWVAPTGMAGLIGLLAGYVWHLRRT